MPLERRRAAVSGWFVALAFRLPQGLSPWHTRDGVVRTTLDAMDSPEGFEVRLSELVVVSRVEGPRHTPVQQGLYIPRPSAGVPWLS